MRIAVIGATGLLGRALVPVLTELGHEVRSLSRHTAPFQIDLTTGKGLDSALDGCEVTLDASNDASRSAATTLLVGTANLIKAGLAAKVRHHIGVSIVGCERVPLHYYRVKVQHERAVERGALPWTIVRATQFHEFLAQTFDRASRWPILPLPAMTLQPVAVKEVAQAISRIVAGEPLRARVEVVGPRREEVRALARAWKAATGRRVALLPVPLPTALGRTLREGKLTSDTAEVRGEVSFDTWLASQPRR